MIFYDYKVLYITLVGNNIEYWILPDLWTIDKWNAHVELMQLTVKFPTFSSSFLFISLAEHSQAIPRLDTSSEISDAREQSWHSLNILNLPGLLATWSICERVVIPSHSPGVAWCELEIFPDPKFPFTNLLIFMFPDSLLVSWFQEWKNQGTF